MKKCMLLLLSMALLAALALGCAPAGAPAPVASASPAPASANAEAAFTPTSGGGQAPGQAENEILTYTPIDPDKTLLVVSRTGNIQIDGFSEAFMAQNPDVQVVCIDITGGNAAVSPVTDWVENGLAPDVMFMPSGTLPDAVAAEWMVDQSSAPFLIHFEAEALNKVAVNARLYGLPGPSQVDCMIYNKTLFEQYGWQPPRTFDEFVSLCLKIREDTAGEIEPWNPNAKYSSEFTKVTEGFVYRELFGGIDNYTWYKGFLAGEETFAGHMEPYYEMLQTLIDNDILREEHFSYSATARGKELSAGKIAMCNYAVSAFSGSEYEFDYMPFPTTVGEDGYICNALTCEMYEPKKPHTPAEQDAINRYLAFFASVEGQRAFINELLMVSSVKNVPFSNAGKLASLQPTLADGRMFTELTFRGVQGAANFSLQDDALAMTKGEKTAAECIAAVDAEPFRIVAEEDAQQPEVLATAAEPFTILETSAYIADMYRECAAADIGLIANNVAFRGNLMRILPGPLTKDHVNTLKPRSFGNETTLVRAKMTGRQLLDALNHPLGNEKIADCVYAFSGLRCEVAPWNAPGERYLSVALADGTPIGEETMYTVAFWDGTVDAAYMTGDVEPIPGTFEELMTGRMRDDGTLTPAKDGRITLIWA